MKKFALTGAAGYIAPRHFKAIKDTENDLIAALDVHDSVGIIDSFFPGASFFIEYERFERHLEKLRREGEGIDYLSICTPNFLHDSHVRLALRMGANAICEKPLVLNPWNLDALQVIEEETGKRVFNILQLRIHESVVALKKKIESENKRHSVKLHYITSRGKWYDFSWKGDVHKSGGIATNIGIHFFDMLIHLFGEVKNFKLEISEPRKMKGTLDLENADVEWLLSIDENDLPEKERITGKRTFRSILIDDEEFEFSAGFTDLHTKVYQDILNGGGFGIEDARPSIELVHKLRSNY